MSIELETMWRIASILALVVSLGSAVAVFMNSPGRKLEGSLTALSTSFNGHKDATAAAQKAHDRRIQAVENEIKHLPTSDEFGELQITVTRVEGDVKRIEGTLDRVDHVVNRIDDYLRAK